MEMKVWSEEKLKWYLIFWNDIPLTVIVSTLINNVLNAQNFIQKLAEILIIWAYINL